MLGAIGFIVAAIAILGFVWSCQKAYVQVDPFRLWAFCFAFTLMAVSMLLWAMITIVADPVVTQNFMLATDVLLLLGTAAMIMVATGRPTMLQATLLAGVVALTVSYRAYLQPPTAYVQDGLLFFNLLGASRLVIVGIFAFIWLPVAMYFASQIAQSNPIMRTRTWTFQIYFVALAAVFGMFAKAQRSAAIIALFIIMIALFGLLALFNVTLTKMQPIKRGKTHAARKA
ncbi:hypothetical protein KDA23_06925 [Candidatus Saccharibacteria bacterium]|nr:hypothetical protein [Candidatus Saccharibacteria bacterium]